MSDLTEAQQQAQAALDKVMNCRFSNFDAGAVIHWVERGMYQVKADPVSRPHSEAGSRALDDLLYHLEPFLAAAAVVIDRPDQYQPAVARIGGISNARDLRVEDFQRLVNARAALSRLDAGEVCVPAPRWRVFEGITHGWWGIEEDILDGNTVLYPKKINREAIDGIVRFHNAALAPSDNLQSGEKSK